MSDVFLAIDPGRFKCGLAVMDVDGHVKEREIIDAELLQARITYLRKKYDKLSAIVLGSGTGHRPILTMLQKFARKELSIELVSERNTTEQARVRYFEKHPPEGLLKLVPRGLLVPPRSIDDYAAVIIGETYIKELGRRTSE